MLTGTRAGLLVGGPMRCKEALPPLPTLSQVPWLPTLGTVGIIDPVTECRCHLITLDPTMLMARFPSIQGPRVQGSRPRQAFPIPETASCFPLAPVFLSPIASLWVLESRSITKIQNVPSVQETVAVRSPHGNATVASLRFPGFPFLVFPSPSIIIPHQLLNQRVVCPLESTWPPTSAISLLHAGSPHASQATTNRIRAAPRQASSRPVGPSYSTWVCPPPQTSLAPARSASIG